MRKRGLLHAIVVNPEYQIIVDERRIAAAKQLGWPTIRAYLARNLNDALARLEAERDENVCRLDLAPSEAVALSERLDAIYSQEAKKRQAAAGPPSGKGQKKSGSGKLPEAVKGDRRDQLGRALGMSGKTLENAKRVVEVSIAERAVEAVIRTSTRPSFSSFSSAETAAPAAGPMLASARATFCRTFACGSFNGSTKSGTQEMSLDRM